VVIVSTPPEHSALFVIEATESAIASG
jgi:hypothetical protein